VRGFTPAARSCLPLLSRFQADDAIAGARRVKALPINRAASLPSVVTPRAVPWRRLLPHLLKHVSTGATKLRPRPRVATRCGKPL